MKRKRTCRPLAMAEHEAVACVGEAHQRKQPDDDARTIVRATTTQAQGSIGTPSLQIHTPPGFVGTRVP